MELDRVIETRELLTLLALEATIPIAPCRP